MPLPVRMPSPNTPSPPSPLISGTLTLVPWTFVVSTISRMALPVSTSLPVWLSTNGFSSYIIDSLRKSVLLQSCCSESGVSAMALAFVLL